MLVVMIILLILAIVVLNIVDEYSWTYFIAIIGIVAIGAVSFLLACFITFGYIQNYTSSDKIAMYEEENKNIENQITTIVNNYQGYEKEIISNVADMETVLIKIPDLKSSELVNTQMLMYVNNNNKIKELKEKQIEMKIYKWSLYFGK